MGWPRLSTIGYFAAAGALLVGGLAATGAITTGVVPAIIAGIAAGVGLRIGASLIGYHESSPADAIVPAMFEQDAPAPQQQPEPAHEKSHDKDAPDTKWRDHAKATQGKGAARAA